MELVPANEELTNWLEETESTDAKSAMEWFVQTLDKWNSPWLRWLQGAPDEQTSSIAYVNGIRAQEISFSDIQLTDVSSPVRAPSARIESLLLDVSSYMDWNDAVQDAQVVESINNHTDIVRLQFRPISIWPVWVQSRQVVAMRKWAKTESGEFFVAMKSTKTSKTQFLGLIWVSPRKSPLVPHTEACTVRHALHIDPAGWVSCR